MKYIIMFFLVFSFNLSTFAGPGHGHKHGHKHGHSHKVVSKNKTKDIGRKHVARLMKSEKIDNSWSDASYENSIKKKFGKKTEWVVTFTNEKGVKGKKLYIFLSLSGKFIAANFTGK